MTALPPAAVLVLAAGEGSRMRSATPKVLHTPGRPQPRGPRGRGCPRARAQGPRRCGRPRPGRCHRRTSPTSTPASGTAVQEPQNGTGQRGSDRARAAARRRGDRGGRLRRHPAAHGRHPAPARVRSRGGGNAATVLTAVLADPHGYGRVRRDADGLGRGDRRAAGRRRRSPGDHRGQQRDVRLRRGTCCARRWRRLTTDNAQGEEYLPDVLAILGGDGPPGRRGRGRATPRRSSGSTTGSSWPTRAGCCATGSWTPGHARRGHRRRPGDHLGRRRRHPRAGRRAAPGHPAARPTHVAAGAQSGRAARCTDTDRRRGAVVRHDLVRGARRSARARRSDRSPTCARAPGWRDGAKVGTYVEIKKRPGRRRQRRCRTCPTSATPRSAKAPTSARPPCSSTTTAWPSTAPWSATTSGSARTPCSWPRSTVGDGAYTAAGSVITEDVPPGAMAVGRARQRTIVGWVPASAPARRPPGRPRRRPAPPRIRHNLAQGTSGAGGGNEEQHS